MKPHELRSLARATCCWVAYKHITGFKDFLGEAMLTIPISEFLATNTKWVLETESPYKEICKSSVVPDFSCDFAGKPRGATTVRFILEAKFLKGKAQNMVRQIALDIIRLSLPINDGLRRYFLLAGESRHFPAPNSDFLFGHNLFGLEQGKGRYIRPKEEIAKPAFSKWFPLFEQLRDAEEKHLADYAYVQYGADEKVQVDDSLSFRVMIWSVGRSKRLAQEGLSA